MMLLCMAAHDNNCISHGHTDPEIVKEGGAVLQFMPEASPSQQRPLVRAYPARETKQLLYVLVG